jgi:predicted RNA-binding Zn ribbon-like protein
VSALPSWYPGNEVKPAPMPLLLVQAFLNTHDLEEDADSLADLSNARDWLVAAGLLDANAPLDEADVERARAVREGIRALLAGGEGRDPEGDHETHPDAIEPLRALAAEHRARLSVSDDCHVRLENAGEGQLGDALFEILLIVHRAQQDGSWARLKLCANPECRWAFFDRSRNQQGNWCNMAVCGNRLKNRQLRARRR